MGQLSKQEQENAARRLMGDFFTAVSFLTVIPVRTRAKGLSGSMIFFPVVGFLIAAVSLQCTSFFTASFSTRFVNLLLVLTPILLTGGLHVDGFADFFDAFFQGKDRQDILRIMKDSHIGVWGAVSIVFLVLVKWELLMIVPFKTRSFLLSLTLSRWAHVFLSYLHGPAKGVGTGKMFAGKPGMRELAGAGAFAMSAAVVLFGLNGLYTSLATALFVFLAGLFYRKRVGGITGDILGATGEMTEVIVLLSVISYLG